MTNEQKRKVLDRELNKVYSQLVGAREGLATVQALVSEEHATDAYHVKMQLKELEDKVYRLHMQVLRDTLGDQ